MHERTMATGATLMWLVLGAIGAAGQEPYYTMTPRQKAAMLQQAQGACAALRAAGLVDASVSAPSNTVRRWIAEGFVGPNQTTRIDGVCLIEQKRPATAQGNEWACQLIIYPEEGHAREELKQQRQYAMYRDAATTPATNGAEAYAVNWAGGGSTSTEKSNGPISPGAPFAAAMLRCGNVVLSINYVHRSVGSLDNPNGLKGDAYIKWIRPRYSELAAEMERQVVAKLGAAHTALQQRRGCRCGAIRSSSAASNAAIAVTIAGVQPTITAGAPIRGTASIALSGFPRPVDVAIRAIVLGSRDRSIRTVMLRQAVNGTRKVALFQDLGVRAGDIERSDTAVAVIASAVVGGVPLSAIGKAGFSVKDRAPVVALVFRGLGPASLDAVRAGVATEFTLSYVVSNPTDKDYAGEAVSSIAIDGPEEHRGFEDTRTRVRVDQGYDEVQTAKWQATIRTPGDYTMNYRVVAPGATPISGKVPLRVADAVNSIRIDHAAAEPAVALAGTPIRLEVDYTVVGLIAVGDEVTETITVTGPEDVSTRHARVVPLSGAGGSAYELRLVKQGAYRWEAAVSAPKFGPAARAAGKITIAAPSADKAGQRQTSTRPLAKGAGGKAAQIRDVTGQRSPAQPQVGAPAGADEAALREAVRKDPTDDVSWQKLAEALAARKQWVEAETAAAEAIALKPDKWQYAASMARVQHGLGRKADAVAAAREALRLGMPKSDPILGMLGIAP